MSAVEVIERALASGVLDPDMTKLPAGGATPDLLREEERAVGRSFSARHKEILSRWNGINLDMLRVYGCGETPAGIKRLAANQWPDLGDLEGVAFADDPAGFVYFEEEGGGVLSFGSDGGDVERVADDLDDFFARYVFGEDAHLFAGDEWKEELRTHGLL